MWVYTPVLVSVSALRLRVAAQRRMLQGFLMKLCRNLINEVSLRKRPQGWADSTICSTSGDYKINKISLPHSSFKIVSGTNNIALRLIWSRSFTRRQVVATLEDFEYWVLRDSPRHYESCHWNSWNIDECCAHSMYLCVCWWVVFQSLHLLPKMSKWQSLMQSMAGADMRSETECEQPGTQSFWVARNYQELSQELSLILKLLAFHWVHHFSGERHSTAFTFHEFHLVSDSAACFVPFRQLGSRNGAPNKHFHFHKMEALSRLLARRLFCKGAVSIESAQR